MRIYSKLVATMATLSFFSVPVLAQEAAWSSSYQLEAAGKYSEAIAAIDLVPANGPDAELKILRRGWLTYLPGNFNESIREYKLAIEKNGKSIDARLGITLPLLAQKRWREAALHAKAVLDLSPNNYTALLRLAIAEEAQGNWAEMAKYATMMTSFYPTDATAYVYLARANAWLNKRGDAVAAYLAVLSRVPGHLEAKAYLEKK